MALWQERDISHSLIEQVIAFDATIVPDFALARLTGLIDLLAAYPERMRAEASHHQAGSSTHSGSC